MAPPNICDPTSVDWLISTYGAFIDTYELAHLLGYPNRKALRQAHAAGRLDIPLTPLEGRRGLYATADDVSIFLRRSYAKPRKEAAP